MTTNLNFQRFLLALILGTSLVIIFGVVCVGPFMGKRKTVIDPHFHDKLLAFLKKEQQSNNKQPYSILITGGAGFIGSHIAEFFCQHKDKTTFLNHIIILDNFKSGFEQNLQFNGNSIPSYIIIERGSIENYKDVQRVFEKHEDVRFVFHLAAEISVAESMKNPDIYTEVNTSGTINILKAATTVGKNVKRVVFSSSAAVYGNPPNKKKNAMNSESDTPSCESPYAYSKMNGEYYCEFFTKEAKKAGKDFNCIVLRYFNVFGERQNVKSAYAAAIPIFLNNLFANEKIVVNGDGKQTRDFVYVKDIAQANIFAAVAPSMNDYGAYNVGYGNSVTILSMAKFFIENTKIKSNPQSKWEDWMVHSAPRPGDVRYSLANVSKLKSKGWRPEFDMDESLKKVIDYFEKISKK